MEEYLLLEWINQNLQNFVLLKFSKLLNFDLLLVTFFGLGSLGAPIYIISFSLLGLMRDAFNVVVKTKFTNR